MKKKIILSFLFAAFLLMSHLIYGQTEPPEPPPPQPGLPIDGGLSCLLIIGVAYGIYAIRKRVKD